MGTDFEQKFETFDKFWTDQEPPPLLSFSALLIAKLEAWLGTGIAWEEAGECLGFMK